MSSRETPQGGSAKGPGWVRAVMTVAGLTFTEARRRRILAAALVLGAAFVALFGVGLYFMSRDIEAHAPPVSRPSS